jgi:hypothetical protein
MFSRGSTTKIPPANQDGPLLETSVIKGMRFVLLTIILESMLTQPVKGDTAEKTSGDNAISIDVVQK